MGLQSTLDEYKADFEKTAPPDVLERMHRATDELRNSGILERVLKKGDKAPQFALKNAENQMVRSKDILSGRSIILTFYRGRW